MTSIVVYRNALGMHPSDRAQELKETYKKVFGDDPDEIEKTAMQLQPGYEARKHKFQLYMKYGAGVGVMSIMFAAMLGFLMGLVVTQFISGSDAFVCGAVGMCVGGSAAVFGVLIPMMTRINKLRDDIRNFEVAEIVLGKIAAFLRKAAEYLGGQSGSLQDAATVVLDNIAFAIITAEKALPEGEGKNFYSADLAVLRRDLRDRAAFFEELRVVSGEFGPHYERAEERWSQEAALGNVSTTYVI